MTTPPDPFAALHLRTDPEDLDTLGQMLSLGGQYIDDQDEDTPGEAQNISKMEDAMRLISDLVTVETTEPEPAEPDDEGD